MSKITFKEHEHKTLKHLTYCPLGHMNNLKLENRVKDKCPKQGCKYQ